MGPLRRTALALGGLLALAPAGARGAEPGLLLPEGPPLPGQAVPALWDGGAGEGVPALAVEGGSIDGRVLPAPNGRAAFRLRAAPGSGPLRVGDGAGLSVEVPLRADAAPALELAARASTAIGGSVAVGPARGPAGADAVYFAPEGRFEPDAGAGVSVFRPGPDPFPRAVPIGARDPSDPTGPAAFSVVSVRARVRVPVRTEPGTAVSVRVGGRTAGPVVADAAGEAALAVELRPGEQQGELVLEDRAGNQQVSPLVLGAPPRASLLAVARPRGPGAQADALVDLFALGGDGRPWSGAAPTCFTALGEPAPVAALGGGRYRAAVPPAPDAEAMDLRVDCTLGDAARAGVRLPSPPARPSRIRLRASPDTLDATAPRALLRAWVETADGERVPPDGLSLRAGLGHLEPQPSAGGTVERLYTGDAARAAGGDAIEAAWHPPRGEGPVLGLEIEAAWADAAAPLVVRVRAIDARGRPVPDVPLTLQAPDGPPARWVTGPDGEARGAWPASAGGRVELRATAGGVERRVWVRPTPGAALPSPGAPALAATLALPIHRSPVRAVSLDTDPVAVVAVPGARARVLVRLLDKDGLPVDDPTLRLSAEHGTLEPARRRPDGTWESVWAPAPDARPGPVRITARSEDGRFADTSTTLELRAPVARRSVAVGGGWALGVGGVSSPLGDVAAEWRLRRVPPLWLHVGAAAWQAAAAGEDPLTGAPLSVRAVLLPVRVGAAVRRPLVEAPRVALGAAAGVALVPAALAVRAGGETVRGGPSLGLPGAFLAGNVSWRVSGAEVLAQAGVHAARLEAGGLGWDGPAGGAFLTVGARFSD